MIIKQSLNIFIYFDLNVSIWCRAKSFTLAREDAIRFSFNFQTYFFNTLKSKILVDKIHKWKFMACSSLLNTFLPNPLFWFPSKHQKIEGFLMFSGWSKKRNIEHWEEEVMPQNSVKFFFSISTRQENKKKTNLLHNQKASKKEKSKI